MNIEPLISKAERYAKHRSWPNIAKHGFIAGYNAKNEQQFTQGYICAVSNMLRERDNPAVAKGLLESIGDVTYKELKEIGVDKFDLDILKKYKLI
jgi:hypothetical protein